MTLDEFKNDLLTLVRNAYGAGLNVLDIYSVRRHPLLLLAPSDRMTLDEFKNALLTFVRDAESAGLDALDIYDALIDQAVSREEW